MRIQNQLRVHCMLIRLYLELTHCHWFKSETGLLLARVKIKNGAPRPKLISNTFEPIALLKYSSVNLLATSGLLPVYFRSELIKLPDSHVAKAFFCN